LLEIVSPTRQLPDATIVRTIRSSMGKKNSNLDLRIITIVAR